MTTAQIKYFLVAAEQLNFTAAAEQLYITQPSLSRQIAAIENELGVQLFTRTNNVVSLTPAGHALYQKFDKFYENYLGIVKEVKEVSASNGHLVIGVLEDQLLPPKLIQAIRSILKTNPNADLVIVRRDSYSLFGGLQDGTIDVGLMLIYEELETYGFQCRSLSEDNVCLAVEKSHFLAQKDTITLDEISKIVDTLPLVMASLELFPPPMREPLSHLPPIEKVDVSFSTVKFVSAFSSIPLYVTAGIGITLVNPGNLLSYDPNVRLIPVIDGPTMKQGLVAHKSNSNPLLAELLNWF